jgi:tetrapyrrole methylase family protein/MazG family protein
MKNHASLTVVGCGIKFLSHITVETKAYIEQSDKVFYLVNDPAMKEWISAANKNTESLDFLYQKHYLRKDSYQAITQYILDELKKMQHLCVVLYGHPGVFAQPGLDAVRLAKEQGYDAKLLPGISAQDCLFSDLLIDPGSHGCHSFEASDFLLYKRKFDPTSHLILWQVDIIGVLNNPYSHDNKKGAELLTGYLNNFYDLNHEVILYEAAQYPSFNPIIQHSTLSELSNLNSSRICTLYLPPKKSNHYDITAAQELGMNIHAL